MTDSPDPNQISRNAWNTNAKVWDAHMGEEGNNFFQILQWPAIASFLDPQPAHRILDVACGNGLTSRKLAESGASIIAIDFPTELIDLARSRPNLDGCITYQVLGATDENALFHPNILLNIHFPGAGSSAKFRRSWLRACA